MMSEKSDTRNDELSLIPKLEESLAQAESESRAKTAFQVKMSLDIRSSINMILEYTEAARKSLGSPEKQLECLDKIDFYITETDCQGRLAVMEQINQAKFLKKNGVRRR